MDDEDDLAGTPPTRVRLLALLKVLALVAVASGMAIWWLYRPEPPEPPEPPRVYKPDPGRPAEIEAKKLPEYTELRSMAKRPLTDAEIARALELTKHPNAWIRFEARGRLSKVRDGPRRAEAVSAVAAGLREESAMIRWAVMALLSDMNARECEGELRAFLTSPVEGDSSVARRALQKMGLPVE